MSQHISDDLPRLLAGEADRAETLAAAAHLRSCPDCQQDLVSAVVAHAALRSAQRFAADVVTPTSNAAEPPPAALPDMSAVFAKVREEAAHEPRSSKRRRALIAVAAAAVVATATGITVSQTVGDSPANPSGQTLVLGAVGEHRGSATATIAGDRMHLDATALPRLDGTHQYEVWLVDPADGELRPLGYVSDDRTAELTVPASVMAQYTSVAISLQRNSEVEFSGDVVARANYG